VADINIGSIKADLGLDPSGVAKGSADAIKAMQNLQKQTGTAMDEFAATTEQGTGRARDSLGRFVKGTQDGSRTASNAFTALSDNVASETRKVSDSVKGMKVAQAFSELRSVFAAYTTVMTGALGITTKFGAEFEQQMRLVNTSAHETEDGFLKLENRVISLSESLGLTKGPQEMSKALYEIYGAGLEGDKAMSVLAVSTKLATAGNTGVAESSKVVTEALRAYNLTAGQAGMVGDQLWRTVEKGRLHFDQLAAVLGPVYTKASQFGVSMEEVNSAMAVLAREMPTSEAATSLERLITQLAAPTEKSTKGLQGMGVELGRGALQTKGLMGVLEQLSGAMNGSDQKMRKLLASSEGLSGALVLLNNGGKDFKEMLEGVSNAQGALTTADKETMKGPIAQFQAFKVEVETTAIKLRSVLLPVFGDVLSVAKGIVKSFSDMTDSHKAFAVEAALVSTAVAWLASGFLLLAPSIVAIPAAFEAVAGSAIVATLGSIALPLTAAIAAGAAFVYAWKKDFGNVQEQVSEFVASIKEDFSGSWAVAIGQAGDIWTSFKEQVNEGLAELQSVWKSSWPLIRDYVLTAIEAIKPALSFIYNSFKEDLPVVITVLGNFFKTTFKLVGDAVAGAYIVVSGALKGMVTGIKGVMETVGLILTLNWAQAWTRAQNLVVEEVGIILDTLVSFGGELYKYFADLAAGIYTIASTIGEAFNQGIRGRFSEMRATMAEMKAIVEGPIGLATIGASAISGITGAGPGIQGEGSGSGDFGGFGSDGPTSTRGRARSANNAFIDVDSLNQKKVSNEDAARARLVAAAEDLVGTPLRDIKDSFGNLGSSANKCADTIRAIGDRAGIKFGVNSNATAQDAAGIRRIGQGTGADYADSFPGRMIGAGEVKAGDLALFKGTSGGYGKDVVTHVGIVIDPVKGLIVDASSSQGKVAKRDIRTFGPDQLYGFVRPQAVEEAGGKTTGGTGVQTYAAASKAAAELIKAQKEAQKLMSSFAQQSESTWDMERDKITEAYEKAYQSAVKAQIPEKDLIALRKEYGIKEATETAATIAELELKRITAEGKVGKVAELQIKARYDQEIASLDKLIAKRSSNDAVRAAARQTKDALSKANQTQLAQNTNRQAAVPVDASIAQGDFQRQGIDPTALTAKYAQFSDQIKTAYSTVTAYLAAPTEAMKSSYDQAHGLLERLQADAIQAEQRKLEDINFNRAMGKITVTEAIQQQGQILAASVQSDTAKRQMILQQASAYQVDLQKRLELQGIYNLKEIEQMRLKLLLEKTLTIQQQVELAALTQAQETLRQQDQAQWVQTVQAGEQAFGGFLQSVLSGQQSFGTAFTGLWKSITNLVIGEIVKMIIKATALQKILSSIFSFFGGPISGLLGGVLGVGGGIGAGLGSLAGGLGSGVSDVAGLVVAHTGGLITSTGLLPSYHTGGVVQSFHSGGSVGGLRSDEVLAKLQVGEYVMSRNQVTAAQRNSNGSSRGDTHVHQHIGEVHLHNGLDLDQFQDRLGRMQDRVMMGLR
jgi:TP901 family phage tail tape measure protein